MDLVYTLGKGSEWDDNEIRYSLRSVEANLPHRKIIVVGDMPDFLQNVIHVPVKDPTNYKSFNTLYKMKVACRSKKISDDFVLMNDDFFVMKPIDKIPYYHKGYLKNTVKNFEYPGSRYFGTLNRTANLLGNGRDFELHCPFIFNKQKFLKLFEVFDLSAGYVYRSVYADYHRIRGKFHPDVKIYNVHDMFVLENETFLSVSPEVVQKPAIEKLLDSNFPNKSIYEK
jgi:hypothetical protein